MGPHIPTPPKCEGKKEVLINEQYYDVTNWIPRHPGGNVIKFYTEEGEDATAAFDQFHGRCITTATKFLNQLPKREAGVGNGE